jgi:hypothetical protein
MRYVNDINPVPKRGHRPVCDIRGRIYNNFAGGIIVQVKDISYGCDNILKNTYKKKSLNMPKGQDEAVNGRKDNTMSKRKWSKGQTMISKTLHRKLKIEQREPPQKRG